MNALMSCSCSHTVGSISFLFSSCSCLVVVKFRCCNEGNQSRVRELMENRLQAPRTGPNDPCVLTPSSSMMRPEAWALLFGRLEMQVESVGKMED
jgi:hypothetical protein